MFFLSGLPIVDVIETIRESDPIKQCGLLPREELQKFDFSTDNSFKSAKDLFFNNKIYQDSFLPHWKKFMKHLLGFRKNLDDFERNSSTVFQIIYYMMRSGKKKMLVHIEMGETIHNYVNPKN